MVASITGAGVSSTTLKLSGVTSSKINLPSLPNVRFDPLSLNASLVVQPSVSLQFLELQGGASIKGLGSLNAAFFYSKDVATLDLDLQPFNLPPPFVSKESSVTLSADIGKDANLVLSASLLAKLQLEKSADPVTINVMLALDSSNKGN